MIYNFLCSLARPEFIRRFFIYFLLNCRVARGSMYIFLRAVTGGDRQAYRLLENLSTDKIFKLQDVRSWGGAV